jgi:hypothetical protein
MDAFPYHKRGLKVRIPKFFVHESAFSAFGVSVTI